MPEQKPEAQVGESKKDEDDYAALKERMLRLAAEFDNYKKRVKVDIEKAQMTGKAEMLKNMLPVLDEFEIAMISVGSVQDKSVAKGIEMVYANLQDALEREGLTELDTDGMYDPYKHEIVVSRADSKKKPGTILEVVKKGYTFNGIMLRPASVIISKEGEGEEMKHQHHLYHTWAFAKKGYDNYAWIFFIGAIGTIIGTSLHLSGGVAAILIAFAFFYIMGRFHTKLEKRVQEWTK